MAKKSFREKIKEDFKIPSPVLEEAQGRVRTKPVPGARLIPVSDILPDPDQPRKRFDKPKLEELAASIKSKGVIEPLTVRLLEGDGRYTIVTGERRFKAAQLAGLEEIPCIIKQVDGQDVLAYQLIENLQREDLSPVEEAAAFNKLLNDGFTQVKLSNLIGKSQPYISQALRILELPQSILKEAEKPNISKEHLLQLSKAENPEALWKEIKEGTTAKEIEEKVHKDKPAKGTPRANQWMWKPEDKAFTITIKFKKKEYRKEDLVRALKMLLPQVAQMDLFAKKERRVRDA